MAEKLQYIEEIAEQTLKELSKSENWFNYLKSASHHYKYSFHESCLLFSQRPEATAVASYDQWNNKMHRLVNKGASGIALLDASRNNKSLKYVFDISDTNGERMPFIWQLKNEYLNRVNEELSSNFDIAQPEYFDEAVTLIADKMIDENIEEMLQELLFSVEQSALEDMGSSEVERIFSDTLKESISVAVFARCGYDFIFEDYNFSSLKFFNTTETIVQLGTATSEISENILREIELSVKTIENEIRQDIQNNLGERSNENANAIQGTKRGNDTQRDAQGTATNPVGQVRIDEEEIPEGQSQRQVSDNATDGNAVSSLPTSGAGSQAADGDSNTKHEKENTAEPDGSIDDGDREQTNQGNDFGEINQQEDIDIVLLRGGSFEGGKQRIIDYYFEENSNSERAKFLKKEYGIGGGTVYFTEDRSGFENHNTKGISIHNRGFDEEPIKLTWSKAAKRIGELIENGRYYELRYPHEKPLTKPTRSDNIETLGADDAPFSFERFSDDINGILNDFNADADLIETLSKQSNEERTESIGSILDAVFSEENIPDISPAFVNEYTANNDFKTYIIDKVATQIDSFEQSKEILAKAIPKKRRTQPEMSYARIEELVPHIMDKRYRYACLKSDGYTDLSFEWIGEDRLVIAHYSEQNGDLMADPDMELVVDYDKKTVMPATYQNDYLGVHQQVYTGENEWRPKLSKQLTSFLSTWLRNIEFQGHVLVDAKYLDEELNHQPIIFDDAGKEYGYDIPHDITSMARLEQLQPEKENILEVDYNVGSTIIEVSSSYELVISDIDDDKITYTVPAMPERNLVQIAREKFDSYLRSGVFEIAEPSEYNIGYGSLGNGITVWNSLIEVNGDFQNLAHIGENGKITYYVDDLPRKIIQQIENHANNKEPAKHEIMQEYGYKFDGMLRIDDEEALSRFDKGHDVFLLYEDNTEALAESEKRLIQHINDGGLVGIEKDQERLVSKELESEILREALKLRVTISGKQHIIDSFNNSQNTEEHIQHIKNEYGAVGMTFDYMGEQRKFKATDNHFIITANLNEPSRTTSYPWTRVADEINKMIRNNEYAKRDELLSQLDKGMRVELDERIYRIEKIDYMYDSIQLADITTEDSTGFPILRKDKLSDFENRLETAGFFEPQRQRLKEQLESDIPIDEQPEKTNFHIKDDSLGIGGAKEKYKRNIAAIKLLQQIESEDRFATSNEQEILSQYVGWGGLSKAFDQSDGSWSSEYNELKNLLDEDEYKDARASTLSSFYTSPTVIKAMYNALENMGFAGGNILEPAMGVGNFFGMLPVSMSKSKMYGVELDSVSGRIAKQLYQRANIDVMGYEHTAYPDNFFDVAIGNVPFGAYSIPDVRYDKHNLNVHDYFFAKSIDKVRPGGVVAFITSKGTLDKKNSSFRKYLAQRAELVGAIRLPNNAFKANAGTEVTSDIIFLKKRDSIIDIEADWVQLGQTQDGIPINQYFADNPHMILGTMKNKIGMYGREDSTCVPLENASLNEQLSVVITHIKAEIEESEYMVDEPDVEDTSIPADPNVKNYSYTIADNEVYYRENSRMNLVDTNAKAKERIKGMIALRKSLNSLIASQLDGMSNERIKQIQRQLNDKYDEFTSSNGRINSRANAIAMNQDSSYYLLCSLEVYDDENQFERKADIFTKQTIRPYRAITSVDTASEALAVSLARKGKVDIGYICSLTNKEAEDVIDDLKGVIYKDPMSDHDNIYEGWQTADEYLSGDVRNKLETVKMVAKSNPDFSQHTKVLEQVQPKDLEASDIDVKLGTVWIPTDYIEQFVHETMNTPNYYRYDIRVSFSKHSGSWHISSKSSDYDNVNANQRFGTNRMNAYWIIEESLNQKSVRITDRIDLPDGTVKYELNKKETLLANQKQNLLQDEFKDWIFKDETRRNHLVRMYNDNFNNIRPREYDGSHLEFIGMNPEIELRPHQKNAVARQLYGGNTLLAHVVGAGKTYTMIAAAMESKRLGLSNKSMFTVPNHLTEQTATEILTLYPSAKVLVATRKDFQTHNRKKFCSRIATGDYDIVVMGHSQFEKIPLSRDRLIRMLNQQLDELTYAIEEQAGRTGMNYNVKQMERTKKTVQARLEKLNSQSRKDDVIEFEELGIDKLFVDESQYFKNLYTITKMRNVAGVQQTEAQKSADLFMKCQYLDELTGGRGITFASGTPISNSMTEMFTVQRYLQMHELRKRGLHHFDCWASVFGETETAYELAPEGNKFRAKKRFAKFYNLPELISVFKNVADIQTNDMLNLPIPKLKGGKHINISVPASDIQRNMISALGDLADKVRNGEVDPTEANMLTITNEGRKIALDQRLINPLLKDDEGSKINTAMQNIHDIWDRTKADKLTQLVFCDQSTPKGNGEFNIYDDLKTKWISKGITENEIAFIHDAKNEKQKAQLFAKVRSGDVRILLGSTQMMGSGTNVQARLKAVHHLDCPWRPSDLQQRDGRILRQGNNNDEVEIYRYVTEETFDSYSYQLVEQKQKFIGQIMTSKAPVRSAADLDEAALSYAEVKALATGNPLIKERMELEVEVSRLKLLKSEHRNQKYRYETQILTVIPNKIADIKQRIDGMKKDIELVSRYTNQDFQIKINGNIYTDKKDVGALIISKVKSLKESEMHEVGEYKGLKMFVQNDTFFQSSNIILHGTISHKIEMGSDEIGNIQRMDNMIKSMPEYLNHSVEELKTAENQLEAAKQALNNPFENEFEMKQKVSRLGEVTHELEMDKKDEVIEVSEDDYKDEQIVVENEVAR